MRYRPAFFLIVSLIMSLVVGCKNSELPVSANVGTDPVIPPPNTSIIPTANVAPAVGWAEDAKPIAHNNSSVNKFADGLEHPRWLYVLPNGDVLVAETNAPAKPEGADSGGIKQWFMKKTKAKAGAAVPSPNRITLLRDKDKDGVAEVRSTFLSNLNSPFGMALVGDRLYVANTDAVVSFPYRVGDTAIKSPATKVFDLPAGPINHHWTKNLIASPRGDKLYVAVGSNSNIAENGFDKEQGRAAVWEIDVATGNGEEFASGLRNPVGMAWVTPSQDLWVAVNERDELGGDLVPDYMAAIEKNDFFGWPYSYYGEHIDERVEQREPHLIDRAIVPDYALGPHTASLGLAFSPGTSSQSFERGMFVGQHGSWNRKPRSGYKVIFVPFVNEKPQGMPIDVLTGFVNEKGEAQGRPVGVALDKQGGLLVADDVGNTVWRVTSSRMSNNNQAQN